MREVVHVLIRVPTHTKPPAFHPDIFFVRKRYFSARSFYGLQVTKISRGEFYHSLLQDLSKYAPLQCSLMRTCYGVCRLGMRMQLKTLSNLLKSQRNVKYFSFSHSLLDNTWEWGIAKL